MHELTAWHGKATFLTLTIADEFMYGESVYKSSVQKFLKRLRKRLGCKLRYVAVGEYGGESGRPHYHLIVYGLDPYSDSHFEAVQDCWKYCYWSFMDRANVYKEVNYQNIRYLFKYMWKKSNVEDVNPPFMLCSKGIGRDWIDKHSSEVEEKLSISYRGVELGVPRYYRGRLSPTFDKNYQNKCKTQQDTNYLQFVENNQDNVSNLIRQFGDLKTAYGFKLKQQADLKNLMLKDFENEN